MKLNNKFFGLAANRSTVHAETARALHEAVDKLTNTTREKKELTGLETRQKITLSQVCRIAKVGRSTIDAQRNRSLREEIRKRIHTFNKNFKSREKNFKHTELVKARRALAVLAAELTICRQRLEESELNRTAAEDRILKMTRDYRKIIQLKTI